MTIRDEMIADFAFEPNIGWAKKIRQLVADGREGTIEIATKDGPETWPAVLFDVHCFVGGPMTLAIHRTSLPAGSDEKAWSVSEVRTGLSAAGGFYMSTDALAEAMQKIAITIAADGREAYEQRIAAQSALPPAERGQPRAVNDAQHPHPVSDV